MPPKPEQINWQKLIAKLPPIDASVASHTKRMEIWKQFDMNGNGLLSLAEIDKAVRDVLEIDELFDCKPVIMRAYQAAKGHPDPSGKRTNVNPDFIEKNEFRLLIVYLHRYFDLWEMFESLDTDTDRRLTIEEFAHSYARLATWGVQIADGPAAFAEMAKGGQHILFEEFAEWALKKHLHLVEDPFDDPSATAPTAAVTGPAAAAPAAPVHQQQHGQHHAGGAPAA